MNFHSSLKLRSLMVLRKTITHRVDVATRYRAFNEEMAKIALEHPEVPAEVQAKMAVVMRALANAGASDVKIMSAHEADEHVADMVVDTRKKAMH